ncbi:MAG: TetR/AcrR family transcriptional regulator [Actinomycetota bacterium]|nr:TetR/AcrR family transcriptional regulator [Actinomycetota bacterium]
MSREERRGRLLDAAIALLEANGPGAVTMERLAERAGVSKPVVYDHFANRTQLVLAVLARTWAEIDTEIAARAAASATPAERILGTFQALLDSGARQGPNVRALVDSVSADPEVEQARRARWREKEATFAAGLERNLGMAPATAAAAAATLQAAMFGAVAHARSSPEAAKVAADVYTTTVLATLGVLSGRAGRDQS